jgi:hypothetical protein
VTLSGNEINIAKELRRIQRELKAPKGQYNEFGKFHYRSCEDILEAVKPLLGEAVLTLNDELVLIGNRYYIRATATLQTGELCITSTAYAREEETKKGMDASQITGSASSYARKYALNGMFLIDDAKDADTQDNTKPKPEEKKAEEKKAKEKPLTGQEVIDSLKKKLAVKMGKMSLETKTDFYNYVIKEDTVTADKLQNFLDKYGAFYEAYKKMKESENV